MVKIIIWFPKDIVNHNEKVPKTQIAAILFKAREFAVFGGCFCIETYLCGQLWFRTTPSLFDLLHNVTQQLHSLVVSHSSLSHPQSATPQAVVSNIVSESFYWTTMVLLEALSLILCPKIACITYGVHETVLGRNSPSLNHEDHHLRVDSLTITDAEPRTPRHGKTGRSSRVDWVASQNGSF
ncbi:hypothetical protein CMV_016775 [Castanea mollissima]|uniref:Uncharacterized protein n=1 Tax=Castanea mollissima TaxID=60419 RepID=A0A8J4R5X4_9ROSI|nr:hypothetical protein CMV_016775 [Castanea mollissima]